MAPDAAKALVKFLTGPEAATTNQKRWIGAGLSTENLVTNIGADGGCLCHSIRYRIAGVPLAQSRCHCRSCRLAAGAPSVAWTVVKRTDFAFTNGDPMRFRSSPSVIRTFCGRCGTPLTYQHDDSPETIDITTATIDQPARFPPTREVWVDHKIAWEPLDPNLRHFATGSSEGFGSVG